MKPKQSVASSSSIRQFGQRSISSIFDPQFVEKKTSKASSSSVSLLDFLDKRLEKRSEKTLQGSTDYKPSSAIASPIPRVLGGGKYVFQPNTGIANSVFQQLKPVPKELKQQQGGSNPPTNPPDVPINRTSLKRKSFSSTDDIQISSSSSSLLVLGDDPKPKRKLNVQRGMEEIPRTIFNHYADGGGWWDTDMVGVDSDEVGSTEIWEGMGSTTIGGL